MKNNEMRTLLHFFIAIFLIFVLELLLRPTVQTRLLPQLWQAYGMAIPENWHIGRVQMLLIEGGSILILILWSFSMMTPEPFRGIWNQWGMGMEQLIQAAVPHFSGNLWRNSLMPTKALQLFGISMLLIFLQLLPYLIAGLYFTRYVMVEGRRIREEDERRRQELDREKNLMLSDIAHDIRNPITTISGYAQALDEGMVKDPAMQLKYLNTIRKKADRVENLISLLFDYAKLNSGGFALKKENLDICEFLRQNAALLYPDVEEAQMELIPEIPNEVMLRSFDRVQFSRVITNLLTNALRYNPKGTKILLRFESDSRFWGEDCLIIADTGEAIDKQMEQRLFEPFSRGDSSRPTDGGSGLGLSIVKRIVDLHGGRIVYRTDIEGYTKGFEITVFR